MCRISPTVTFLHLDGTPLPPRHCCVHGGTKCPQTLNSVYYEAPHFATK